MHKNHHHLGIQPEDLRGGILKRLEHPRYLSKVRSALSALGGSSPDSPSSHRPLREVMLGKKHRQVVRRRATGKAPTVGIGAERKSLSCNVSQHIPMVSPERRPEILAQLEGSHHPCGSISPHVWTGLCKKEDPQGQKVQCRMPNHSQGRT